uniref:Uncharacterized protein n=1 Tax=Syphacia muris TaxID=451379 RepID=A0A0N5AL23_9BILA
MVCYRGAEKFFKYLESSLSSVLEEAKWVESVDFLASAVEERWSLIFFVEMNDQVSVYLNDKRYIHAYAYAMIYMLHSLN